jgi:outer membrane lipoprotein-sorting protein
MDNSNEVLSGAYKKLNSIGFSLQCQPKCGDRGSFKTLFAICRIFARLLWSTVMSPHHSFQTAIAHFALLLSGSTLTPAHVYAEDVDPVAIVEKADQVRFPREGFQVDVSISTTAPEREPDNRKYRILSKGNENTIVITTEPASEKGQILLMRSHDLWIFLPNVSQPVRLSLSQRLTGEVANGDLARANFAGDYVPKLLRTETIDGDNYHVLELTAVDRSVTYHRVLYWVRQTDFRPHKAEFYTLSDRLLKKCKYQNFQRMAGQVRPTRLVMEDALHQDEQSVLDYSNMQLRELPDKVFTKEYLKKLE